MKSDTIFCRAVLLAVLIFTGGCSSFNREWRQAAPSNGLEGRWQGSWQSEANSHSGNLRCIIAKNGDGTYRAHFHATYAHFLTFGYTAALQVAPDGQNLKFKGDANLGKLGGIYHYDGHASGTNFFSLYSCPYDHGTFQMTRP